jgi:hypothetical protein
MVAMLRSCVEAPASSASRTNAARSSSTGSAASSSIVVNAPTTSASPQRVIPRSGRRVMSTSRSGFSTPSLRIKSICVVPPAAQGTQPHTARPSSWNPARAQRITSSKAPTNRSTGRTHPRIQPRGLRTGFAHPTAYARPRSNSSGTKPRWLQREGACVANLVVALSVAGAQGAQGVRFRTAWPCSRSAGTDTWSCTTSQTPSIRRKHAVQRTHRSVMWPLASVPFTWLTA